MPKDDASRTYALQLQLTIADVMARSGPRASSHRRRLRSRKRKSGVSLRYAFPHAFRRIAPQVPRLRMLHDRVAARPNIRAYLASKRRIAFNEDGIFRHYPELFARG